MVMCHMEPLDLHIEAIVFASDKPVKPADIQASLNRLDGREVSPDEVAASLTRIAGKYDAADFAFSLIRSGGGYQFLTKPEYAETVAALLHQVSKRRLTTAALETLAIIAYKQPVSKSEIEQIRGVNSDYTVNKLMEKELVEIVGRSHETGKPLLYGTTAFFMDYFGINDLAELPRIREFSEPDNQIGAMPELDKPSEN